MHFSKIPEKLENELNHFQKHGEITKLYEKISDIVKHM
jgi:hypothetical protein